MNNKTDTKAIADMLRLTSDSCVVAALSTGIANFDYRSFKEAYSAYYNANNKPNVEVRMTALKRWIELCTNRTDAVKAYNEAPQFSQLKAAALRKWLELSTEPIHARTAYERSVQDSGDTNACLARWDELSLDALGRAERIDQLQEVYWEASSLSPVRVMAIQKIAEKLGHK